MYVLDTNAFYYAAGISECTYDVEKLRELVRKNETFLSTTSLFEFLTKYQNDIETVKLGGRYLWQNRIRLASNVINPLPEHFTDDLVNITEHQLQLMCTDVLENKIDVESRFTTLLFDVCLFSGYYFVVMSDGKEPCEYCYSAMTAAYRMFTEVVLDVFRELYRDGYKTDDCENYIRNGFYNLLAFMLEKGIPFTETRRATKIKREQLFGIEFDRELYALVCANMLIHKDGKTNLEHLDSRTITAGEWIKSKPITKVLMNPPFETTYGCLKIVKNVLDNVPVHTECAFILPDKKLETDGSNGKSIIKSHCLKKIIKLPEKTFNEGVTTSIFVFEAGVPQGDKEIFGCYIKEDGLETIKNQGRHDVKGRWSAIEDKWVDIIHKQVGDSTVQWISPKEHLSYQIPIEETVLCEEDFLGTALDYIMFNQGVDTDELYDSLLSATLMNIAVGKGGIWNNGDNE